MSLAVSRPVSSFCTMAHFPLTCLSQSRVRILPSGEKVIVFPFGSKIGIFNACAPLVVSQSLTPMSSMDAADATILPSGENATMLTAQLWALGW